MPVTISPSGMSARALRLLQRVDPARVHRLKGLRLVLCYALAATLAPTLARLLHVCAPASLGMLAANIALWASVSDMRTAAREGAVDLPILCAAGMAGAASHVLSAPALMHLGPVGPELTLVFGAFLVGALKRFGPLGAGVGSQWYIGQLLADGLGLDTRHLGTIALAGAAAAVVTACCRLILSVRHVAGPRTPAAAAAAPVMPTPQAAWAMGLQAGTAALIVVGLDAAIDLEEPLWAITACTYVVAGSLQATRARGRQRIIGTIVGVLLGLTALPLTEHLPWAAWALAASAMMIYALALETRYDVCCGAYAFTLVSTLAAQGEHSIAMLASRAWETLLGALVALVVARVLLPLRIEPRPAVS